jgi:AraC-like DNA-binding protein
MQRAAALACLPAVLAEFGVAAESLCKGLAIDLPVLRPDMMVPLEDALLLLDRASQATSCPHIGLIVGQRFRLAEYGPLAKLMATAPTLEHAILDLITWQPGYTSAASAYLVPLDNGYAWGYAAYARGLPGVSHLYFVGVAAAKTFIDELTSGMAAPTEAWFTCRAPADADVFENLLGVRVCFGRPHDCLILSRAAMATPLPSRDALLRRGLLSAVAQSTGFVHQAASTRVRHHVRGQVAARRTSLTGVAAQLGMHPRTLRRRLKEEDTSFEAIVEDVRFAAACELLSRTDLAIAEVGRAVGYSDHGNFTHAFRRWTGQPPSAWRKSTSRSAARSERWAVPQRNVR